MRYSRKILKGSAVLNEKLPSKDLRLHFSCSDLLERHISDSVVHFLCRDGIPSSTHQYKLPDNISTNSTSGGSL